MMFQWLCKALHIKQKDLFGQSLTPGCDSAHVCLTLLLYSGPGETNSISSSGFAASTTFFAHTIQTCSLKYPTGNFKEHLPLFPWSFLALKSLHIQHLVHRVRQHLPKDQLRHDGRPRIHNEIIDTCNYYKYRITEIVISRWASLWSRNKGHS